MVRRGLVIVFLIALLALSFLVISTKADSTDSPDNTLLISEIKINNDSAGLNEFIEIFNNSDETVPLGQYKLVYFNVYNPTTQVPTHQSFSNVELEPYQYFIFARDTSQIAGSVALSPISSLKDDQGTIQLLGPDLDNPEQSKIYDQVAWLNSSSLSENVYKLPTSTKSLQRYTRQTVIPIDFEADWIADTSTPYSTLYIEPVVLEDLEGGSLASGLTCEGIILSEVLPNPTGADSTQEFIELYNPTDEVIPLAGCTFQTAANSKTYAFSDIEMQPNQYLAFYDSQTGLTLPNSAGGTVWLLSPTEELQAITYPGELADDVAWALFSNSWKMTYQPTPNAANVLVSTKPCPAGQVRNPDTNRCRSILTSSAYALNPCNPGQERNPETNRCRLISSSGELVPCKPDQERNPETNRCRKVGANSLKPCAPGQSRNPATNRCKKITGSEVAGIATVKDVESAADNSIPIQWGLAGLVSIGAISYGVYEWRQDIINAINRLRGKA